MLEYRKRLGQITWGLGMVAFVGWILRVPLLVTIHPAWAPMQPNTAFGFLCLGWSVGLYQSSFRVAARIGSASMGLAALIEYATGLRLIPSLITPWVDTASAAPGLMSPLTAVCFIVPLLAETSKDWTRDIAVVVVGALSSTVLIGYAGDIGTSVGLPGATSMAFHTAFGFLVWSVAEGIAGLRRRSVALAAFGMAATLTVSSIVFEYSGSVRLALVAGGVILVLWVVGVASSIRSDRQSEVVERTAALAHMIEKDHQRHRAELENLRRSVLYEGRSERIGERLKVVNSR